ncbi:unnamed protein product [Hermetia illucens]|uniref:Uncharacterized protein n=1 Tax=Hermetia illucens TaxID=343691 RepID=A0A7R8U9T8_HERIL|nr:CDK5RAP3-like protein [Hermetia illucens]CAD7076802.1 unnamed protein product [Hermetia illucens]
MNEADIPIDIHTGKLQEWLVSRRIVPKQIQIQVRDIRSKIANAMKDMPANEDLIKLLSGAHINYFHCQQIIEILKHTEKDTRSLFGTYGSQRMKDWQEIIKLYERDNVYLGEAAQILVRNLTYEIPGIKRQITKFEQQSTDALKRIQDLGKTETILLHEHAALCQQLGIKGDNLKDELTAKVRELPKIYDSSIKNIKTLKDPIKLYEDFTKNENCLPILKHLVEFGNTTVYQYMHKEAPLVVEEPPINLKLSHDEKKSTAAKNDNEIDFGFDDITVDTSGGGIDFGTDEIQLETGDIDWGESIEVSTTDVDLDVPLDDYGIVVEGVGMDGGKAKGAEAYTILDSPTYRDQFIDELYELESFLKLRNFELGQLESSSNVLLSLMDSISTHDAKSIAKMLDNVESIISDVSNEQTQHLFQLKHSPKYADLLSSKLKQKLAAVEKTKTTCQVLKAKSEELNEEKVKTKPVLDKMIEQTKVLEKQIEKDISKRYKNRVVNLMGGANML